jgi:hypothetical protein
MPTDADLLNLPLEFEYKGKVYKILREPTMVMETAFADWVLMEAFNRIERMHAMYNESQGQSGLNPQQYEMAMNRLTDDQAAGDFDWGSTIVDKKYRESWGGLKFMIMLRFKAHHPEVGMRMIEEIFRNPDEKARLYAVLRPTKAADAESEKENDSEKLEKEEPDQAA